MSDRAQKFAGLVQENKMSDAKKVFERTMQERVVDMVSKMRQEVAANFFNKK